jgi:hypothetical protein
MRCTSSIKSRRQYCVNLGARCARNCGFRAEVSTRSAVLYSMRARRHTHADSFRNWQLPSWARTEIGPLKVLQSLQTAYFRARENPVFLRYLTPLYIPQLCSIYLSCAQTEAISLCSVISQILTHPEGSVTIVRAYSLFSHKELILSNQDIR